MIRLALVRVILQGLWEGTPGPVPLKALMMLLALPLYLVLMWLIYVAFEPELEGSIQ